jgi:hypothetical protein
MLWTLCAQGKYSIAFPHGGGGGGLEREKEVLAVLGSTTAEEGRRLELLPTVLRQFPAPSCG